MSKENECNEDKNLERTTAIGTARFAYEFLNAALHEHARAHHRIDPDISSVPAMYLIGHGIELSLKAYLLSQGMTAKDLRKLGKNGHDLLAAWDAAILRGLQYDLSFKSGDRLALQLLNDRYATKEFEYITTGAVSWPKFGVLVSVASRLFNLVALSVGYNRTMMPRPA